MFLLRKFFCGLFIGIATLNFGNIYFSHVFALERLDLLPKDVNYIIHISNTKKFGDNLRKSPIGRLWSDKKFREFCGDINITKWLKEKFIESIEKNEGEKGKIKANMQWEQITDIKGEFILAFRTGKKDEPPEVFFVCEYTPEEYRKMLEIDKKLYNMEPETSNFSEYTFHGVKIYHFIKDDKKNKKIRHTWETYVNGTAIQGDNKEWLERNVLRLLEEKPQRINEAHPFIEFIITKATIRSWLVDKKTESGDKTNRDCSSRNPNHPNYNISKQKILSALGLNQMDYIHFYVSPSPKKLAMSVKTGNLEKLDGLFTLLDISPISGGRKLSYVPRSTVYYQEVRFNVRKLWENIPKILNNINPALTLQFQGVCLMFQSQVGIDIYNDLICLLDSNFITYNCLEENNTLKKVTAIGVTDTNHINRTLAAIFKVDGPAAKQFGQSLKRDSIGGYTIYSLSLGMPKPKLHGNAKQPQCPIFNRQPVEIAISAVDGNLLIGNPSLVREIIQNAVKPLNLDAKAYYKSDLYYFGKKVLPDHLYSYSLTDCAPVIEQFIKIFKNPSFTSILTGVSNKKGILSTVDFQKLPHSDYLAQFVQTILTYVQFKDKKLICSWILYGSNQSNR